MTHVILEDAVTVQALGLLEGGSPSYVEYIAISWCFLDRVFPLLMQKEGIFSNTLVSKASVH